MVNTKEAHKVGYIFGLANDFIQLSEKYPDALKVEKIPGSETEYPADLVSIKSVNGYRPILRLVTESTFRMLFFVDLEKNLSEYEFYLEEMFSYPDNLPKRKTDYYNCERQNENGKKHVSLEVIGNNLKNLYKKVLEIVEGSKITEITFNQYQKKTTNEKIEYISSLFNDIFELALSNSDYKVESSYTSLGVKYDDGWAFDFPICEKRKNYFASDYNYFNFKTVGKDFSYSFDHHEIDDVIIYERYNGRDRNVIPITERTFFNELNRFHLVFSERLKGRNVINLANV